MESIVKSFYDVLNRSFKSYSSVAIDLNAEDSDNARILRHFRSNNLTNGFFIERFGYFHINGKRIDVYAIGNSDEKAIPTNVQMSNMNINSGYNINITEFGTPICNVFINKKFLGLDPSNFDEKNSILFISNLRYACSNIASFLYPMMDSKKCNMLGSVLGVAIAKKIIAVTPEIVAKTYNISIPLAESVIDKYNAVDDIFTGLPWIF